MSDHIAAIGGAIYDIQVMVAEVRELGQSNPDDRHDLKCVHSYLDWCVNRINNIEERNSQ